jgi:hypothetical protein
MSAALARLARTRHWLALAAALRPGLAWSGRALAWLAVAEVIARTTFADGAASRVVGLVGALAFVAVGGVLAAIAWRRTTLPQAALWVEGRAPALEYALVTLADSRAITSAAVGDRLRARAEAVRWEPAVRQAVTRTMVRPVLELALGALLLALAPLASRQVRLARESALVRRPGADAGIAPRAGVTAPDVRVRVTPPAYSGLPVRDLGAVAAVSALVDSRVELRGRGDVALVRATVDDRTLKPVAVGDGWRIDVAMPSKPVAVRVTRGAASRLLVLEPIPDSAPMLVLRLPMRDTVLREASGAMPLAADARDDFGLSEGRLEYIVSSGEGESFKFRSGAIAARRLGAARSATLAATLDLGALSLVPGDIVHLRAVARDANPRGTLAASETRTLRVMRRGEADSVAIEAAPPPEADKSILSQRMLIQITERLVARANLPRPTLVQESRRIAVDQRRLRRAVGDIVFARLGGESSAEHAHSPGDQHDDEEAGPPRTPEEVLAAADRATGTGAEAALDFEGDETPVVAINRPLLEAYNAMWEAALSLDIGEPRSALPPMRRALEAIQRARAAERVYLRGRPPAVVIDLARVRLAGKEQGEGSMRAPRGAIPDASRVVASRLAATTLLAARDPAAAADSLLMLRVETLGANEPLARALGDAAEALRRGGDVTVAMIRARRVAAGEAGAGVAAGAWTGAWSNAPPAGGAR